MPDPQLISIPFVMPLERRNNPGYSWNNDFRTGERHVIFQHTLEGAGAFRIGGVTHSVPVGYAFLAVVPERSRYFFPREARQPWAFRWFNIYGAFGIELWRDFRKQFGPVLPLPLDSSADKLLQAILQLVSSHRNPDVFLAGEMAYEFYLAWWRQVQSEQPTAPQIDRIRESEQFCHQRFRRPIAVKEIASHVGLTREHFTRLFRSRHQMGPATYLRNIRLKEARRLQRMAPFTLKELALRIGFASARQLARYLDGK